MQTIQTIIVCSKCGGSNLDNYLGPHNYDCWYCKDCGHDTQKEWMTDQRCWTDESDKAGYRVRRIAV